MGALDGWDLTTLGYADGSQEFHLHPVGDLREHVLCEMDCWCAPWTAPDTGPLITHNSLDRRELTEGQQ